ncbi:MAG: hypothetical protein KA004_07575 [Verrucomicrobiales bacterium]|nr:hypothetical protein [Verrucomicrobiales bacterium]
MKRIIGLFGGTCAALVLASCGDTVYQTYPQTHHYHSDSPRPRPAPSLGTAPSGGQGIEPVGPPDSFSGP